MSDFLLIHGSANGAWCWDDLIPELTRQGHTARAIDLPSHGQDATAIKDVTLDLYADAIGAALRQNTVLVAHSMAGFPVTLAADRMPDQIGHLIYLCAHVPVTGKSIADMRQMADAQPLAAAMLPSADGLAITIDPDKAIDVFYHDVPPAKGSWAVGQLCPQPIKPQVTPYPDIAPGTYPRHYIRCTDDRAIPPSYQVDRTSDWAAGTVTDIATSHSPFLSDPAHLAATLIRITES